ncbi:MAG: hypothetical protein HC828_21870 [Blastochloris sp.]|nr:hypothetical protein [Blastochloris sp.]
MTQLDVGQTIGQYQIETLIGGGAAGQVYQARHVAGSQLAVVKLLRVDFASDPTFLARFNEQVGAVARLRHPNIVTIHDFGSVNGRAYQAMEWMSMGRCGR